MEDDEVDLAISQFQLANYAHNMYSTPHIVHAPQLSVHEPTLGSIFIHKQALAESLCLELKAALRFY